MIQPTVGRIVLYHPAVTDPGGNIPGDPFAAIITRVHSDISVNITAFSPDGIPFGRTSVRLKQPENRNVEGAYCEWMPHQIAGSAA